MKSHNEFMKEANQANHFTNQIKKELGPESKEDVLYTEGEKDEE